ncbi:MAG: hypothetical protein QM786_19125 [Breznakibacter sp.]
MKKLQFKTTIQAPVARVYRTMLGIGNIETYRQWTAEFNPSSTYEGSWDKGAKIRFIGTDENGHRGGMVAEIAEHIPNQFVSIRHYGILDGNDEITDGPEVEKWAGGLENYSFEGDGNATIVTVDVDVTEDFIEYFNITWPKAFRKLKEISEKEE